MFKDDGKVLHFSAPKGAPCPLPALLHAQPDSSLHRTQSTLLSPATPLPSTARARTRSSQNSSPAFSTSSAPSLLPTSESWPSLTSQVCPWPASVRFPFNRLTAPNLFLSVQAGMAGQKQEGKTGEADSDDEVPELVENFDKTAEVRLIPSLHSSLRGRLTDLLVLLPLFYRPARRIHKSVYEKRVQSAKIIFPLPHRWTQSACLVLPWSPCIPSWGFKARRHSFCSNLQRF